MISGEVEDVLGSGVRYPVVSDTGDGTYKMSIKPGDLLIHVITPLWPLCKRKGQGSAALRDDNRCLVSLQTL